MSALDPCPVATMARRAAETMALLRGTGGLQRRVLAECMAPSTVPACLVEPPSRPGGRLGRAVVPIPELRAAGWRVLPLPVLTALSVGERPSLYWFSRDWFVVPPETSPERARRFDGRGRAQQWASERYRAERVDRP